MPRIEQLPDGTYVKRLTPFEADLIERLYQEIRDRRNEGATFQSRISDFELLILTLQNEVKTLKMELLDVTSNRE